MAEVGRDLWRPFSPIPAQVASEEGAQGHIQVPLEGLQGADSTVSLGSLCQCSITCAAQKYFWCSYGTSHVPVCAHCSLSCFWAPLKRAWPHSFDSRPLGIYKHWSDPLSAFSSPGWTVPVLSACPHTGGAPSPSLFLWSSGHKYIYCIYSNSS